MYSHDYDLYIRSTETGPILPLFLSECSDVLREENWEALKVLAEKRDAAAEQTKKPDAELPDDPISLKLPLYRIESNATALKAEIARVWEKGPEEDLWNWALAWIPYYFVPWDLPRSWKLWALPDHQLDTALSFMLRIPIGWSRPQESDAIADYLETFMSEIREESAATRAVRQRIIDKAVLAHLDTAFAYFSEKNLRGLTRARAQLLEDVLKCHLPEVALDYKAPPKHSGKIKLGIVIRYFKPFIDNWVLAGFIINLPRDKFEITLYSVQDIEQRIRQEDTKQKAFHARFIPLVDSYVPLDTMSLKDTVKRIRSDANDIVLLASSMHTGTGKAHLLQAYRLAPIEIVTTNTASSCGFEAIDYYITGDITEPPNAADHYSEKTAALPGHFYAMAFDPAPDTAAAFRHEIEDDVWLEAQGIPSGAPLLFSGSGWPKLTPETVTLWAEILHAVPKAHLVLDPYSPSWRGGWFALAQNELIAGIMGPVFSRCHILDLQASRKTMVILSRAAAYLDAFPYSGNMALREPLLMGCPVITRSVPHQRGLQGAAMLKSIGVGELVARNNEDYKLLAVGLLYDKAALEKTRTRIKAAMKHAPIYDSASVSREFGELLDGLMIKVAPNA